MRRDWADVTQHDDGRALRRFPEAKRSALTACVLVEAPTTILAHLGALHEQLLTKKRREATPAFEPPSRRLRRPYRRGLVKRMATGTTLLDPARSAATPLGTLLAELEAAALRTAVAVGTDRPRLEDRGDMEALRARSPGLRRALPALFALPWQGEPGSEQLVQGRAGGRPLDAGTLKPLPRRAPTALVPRQFWPALTAPDGHRARRPWELGRAVAVREGLRVGAVSLPTRRRHRSCAPLVSDPTRWQQERANAETALQWPSTPEDVCARLQHEGDVGATPAAQGLAPNDCVTIRRDRLHLQRRAALDLSPRLQQ